MEEANKSDQQFLDLTIVAKTDLTDYGLWIKKKFLCRQIFTTTTTEMIKRQKKNSSIKPSVMVSATPYNFFTSLPFINEDGKTPKMFLVNNRSLQHHSNRSSSQKNKIILYYFELYLSTLILYRVIFINSYIILSYIYQLLMSTEILYLFI